MQAVILAGGLGTRLGARTAALPKSLLPVAGRPFIDWQLERLAACRFDEVVLCVGHLGGALREHVGDGSAHGLVVRFSEDGERLMGTAGAVRRALALLEDRFLVTYGDSYLPFDYGAPLRDLALHPAALGTMSVFPNAGRWDASNTAIEGDRVVRYAKGAAEPALDHIDYGALALRREVIAALPAGEAAGLEALQSALAAAGKLRALVARERFYEIGSENGLSALEAHLALGQ